MTDEFTETNRGTVLSKSGEYFPATLLADLKIPGLPKTRAGIYKIAAREAWPLIHRPGKGAKDGVKFFLIPKRILVKINQITHPAKAHQTQTYRHSATQLITGSGEYSGLKVQCNSSSDAAFNDFAVMPQYDVQTRTEHGAVIHSEQIVNYLAFKQEYLYKSLNVNEKYLALISVKGDSMEPTLSNGDLILIDTCKGRIEDNAIYVLQLNGDLIVKRLQRMMDGKVLVKSDNPAYCEEELDSHKAQSLHVLGRVVLHVRRM